MEKSHFIKLISERTGLSESSITEDLVKLESEIKLKEKEEVKNGNEKKLPSTIKNELNRIDAVTLRLFGLLFYIEKNEIKDIKLEPEYNFIENVLGSERFLAIKKQNELIKDKLLLEAEVFYEKNKNLNSELEELKLNFEEDYTKYDFTKAMTELSLAERGKDEVKIEEIGKKIQALTVKLNEISKRRR
jgi:hypothetical protein